MWGPQEARKDQAVRSPLWVPPTIGRMGAARGQICADSL